MADTNIDPTVKALFDANVHLGHRKNRLHPKARNYIYKIINGSAIIDLSKTADQLNTAKKVLSDAAKEKKSLLVVATKRIISQYTADLCKEKNIFYITTKWPPGLLTNFDTIMKNVKKLIKLEEDKKSGAWDKFVKHEIMKLDKEIAKLKKVYGGVATLGKKPDLIFLIDSKHEKNALDEAKKNNIPVVAVIDTNSNPQDVTYPIVANDDSASSLEYLVKDLLNAYVS